MGRHARAGSPCRGDRGRGLRRVVGRADASVLDRQYSEREHFLGSVPRVISAIPMSRRSARVIACMITVVAALSYLYDPPWIGGWTCWMRGGGFSLPGTVFC